MLFDDLREECEGIILEQLDLSKYAIRTDLAIEAREIAIADQQKHVHDQEDLSVRYGEISLIT